MRKTQGEIEEDRWFALTDKDRLEKELGDAREKEVSLEGQRERAKSSGGRKLELIERQITDKGREIVLIVKVLKRIEALQKAGTYNSERARVTAELKKDGDWDYKIPAIDKDIRHGLSEGTARMSRALEKADPERRKQIELLNAVIQENHLWGVIPVLFKPVKKKGGRKPGRQYPEDEALLEEIECRVRAGMKDSKAITSVAKEASIGKTKVDYTSMRTQLSKAYYARAGSPVRKLREE